jgi:hypothetical protein
VRETRRINALPTFFFIQECFLLTVSLKCVSIKIKIFSAKSATPIVLFGVLFLYTVIILFMIAWTIATSLKGRVDYIEHPLSLFPAPPQYPPGRFRPPPRQAGYPVFLRLLRAMLYPHQPPVIEAACSRLPEVAPLKATPAASWL